MNGLEILNLMLAISSYFLATKIKLWERCMVSYILVSVILVISLINSIHFNIGFHLLMVIIVQLIVIGWMVKYILRGYYDNRKN